MDDMDESGPDEPGCYETLLVIERYLDGEVEVDLEMAIHRHLSGCDPCMQRTEFRRHLKVMISTKCAERTAPPALLAKVRELLSEEDLTSPPG